MGFVSEEKWERKKSERDLESKKDEAWWRTERVLIDFVTRLGMHRIYKGLEKTNTSVQIGKFERYWKRESIYAKSEAKINWFDHWIMLILTA